MFLRSIKRMRCKIILCGLMIISLTSLYTFRDHEVMYWMREQIQELYDVNYGEDSFDLTPINVPGFLIHTSTCKIPNIPLNHSSIAKFKLYNPEQVRCSKKKPLTEASGLTLLYYPWRVTQYGYSISTSVNCSYRGIVRVEEMIEKHGEADKRGRKLKDETISITDEVTPIDEDGIFVSCVRANYKRVFYENVHYFIQPRRVEEKMKKHKEMAKKDRKRKLNVILMGIDSVSRANLLRNMPETYDYLMNNLGAIDMLGYNKVGDNTYPNLVPMLTGQNREVFEKGCLKKQFYKYDDCPFLWKNYSQEGYVTAFGEDAPWMGIFRYHKAGFLKEPTDYYNTPYFFQSDETIGHYGGTVSRNGKMCQGDKFSMSVIYDYSYEILKTFRGIPTFHLYWISSVTHDDVTRAAVTDLPSLEYLKKLHYGGFLEDSILFFLSDHGVRFGDIRATYAGMLEERLPYLMVVLPEWFKETHRDAYHNLKVNSRRLITPFDMHYTLKDILEESFGNTTISGKHGMSLFHEVPDNRTCEELGIPHHYCNCQTTKPVDPKDHHLQASASFTILKLNSDLKAFNNCVELTMDKVVSGRVSTPSKGTEPKRTTTVVSNYIVVFETKPGGAQMESTVQYQGRRKYRLMGEVSRINTYGNQSHCIDDFTMKKYCYCKDMLS